MKAMHEQWRRQWQDISGQSTDPISGAVCENLAFRSDIWQLDAARLRQCFALFNGGEQILSRALAVQRCTPVSKFVDNATLLNYLEEAITRSEKVLTLLGKEEARLLLGEKNAFTKVRAVYRGDEQLRQTLFCDAAAPTFFIEDDLHSIVKRYLGMEASAAYFFLLEPLYRLANSYSIANWVFWGALNEKLGIDPLEPLFDLYQLNAQAGWSDDELFVFVES